jgi:hypothetical protein
MSSIDTQVLVSVDQQLASSDVNNLSTYLYNIFRNFNINIFEQNSCIVNGLTQTWGGGGNPTVMTVSAGVAVFALAGNYKGSIFYWPGTPALTITAADHTNPRIDGIDITYTEIPGNSQIRNFINPGTGIVTPTSTNTQTISTYSMVITTGTPSGSPAPPAVPSGYVRLATYEVPSNSGGTITVTNQTTVLPLIWENQTFPGTPNTANQSSSLADSLASIRSQLNAIIGSTNWFTVPPVNLTTLYSAKKGLNIIRNSSMVVAQRGTGGTVVNSTPAYTADGWIVGSVGASTNWTRQDGNVNDVYALLLEPAGTLTDLYVKQRIESTLMIQIGITTITIQAYIYNGTSSPLTPTLALNAPTGVDDYTSVINVLAATNLQTIGSNSGAVVAYTFAITSVDFNNGMEIIFDFAAQVQQTKSIEITLVDVSPTPNLTVGLTANPPSPTIRQIADELAFCQRYLVVLGDGILATQIFGTGINTSSTVAKINIPLPVKMRVPVYSATGSISVSAFSDFQLVTGAGVQETVTALSYSGNSSTLMMSLSVTVSSGLTANVPINLLSNNTLNAQIYYSAEI